MPRKDISEISIKLAGIDAKLDGLADMLKKHDQHLTGHDERLRHLEKQLNVAFGWAGAVGFVASLAWAWFWEKIHGR